MNIFKHILVIVLAVSLLFAGSFVDQQVSAQLNVFRPAQGGTGIGSATSGQVGDCLTVSDDTPFTFALDTCGSGGGSFPFDPATHFGTSTNATSTPLWLKGNLFSLFASSTSVFDNSTTTRATISSSFWLPSLTSALIQTDAAGLTAEYAGTSCTNQFVRALSALGIATCATVDISADTNLTAGDALTLTNDDIDFDGGATPSGDLGGTWASPSVTDDSHAHTGSTISGVDISSDTNLAVGSGLILTDDTVQARVSTSTVPSVSGLAYWTGNGTPSTLGSTATTTFSTTGALQISGGTPGVIGPTPFVFLMGNLTEESSFFYATSTTWTGTTTIDLGPAYRAQTWNGVKCFTDTGTLGVSFYDGTNRMTYIPTASTTVNTNALTTNNTFTASEKRYVDLGTPASSPKRISCTVSRTLDFN